jgi:hypothetical protein
MKFHRYFLLHSPNQAQFSSSRKLVSPFQTSLNIYDFSSYLYFVIREFCSVRQFLVQTLDIKLYWDESITGRRPIWKENIVRRLLSQFLAGRVSNQKVLNTLESSQTNNKPGFLLLLYPKL